MLPCYCCNKYIKQFAKFKKHIKCCSEIANIVYKFENKNTASFQDNFKYTGDFPFVVYFDYERTTGDDVFNDKKTFVISYCQIYAFHSKLNLDKSVIFFSFKQSLEEIYHLNHFLENQVKYFDHVTFKQLKDTANNVLKKEKESALSEMLSTEHKFTVDMLVKCFNELFKSRFNEPNEIKKQLFTRDNPVDWSNQKCVICNFKLAVSLNEGHGSIN